MVKSVLITFITLDLSFLDLILLILSSRCKELILATIRAFFDLIDENTRQVCISGLCIFTHQPFFFHPRMFNQERYFTESSFLIILNHTEKIVSILYQSLKNPFVLFGQKVKNKKVLAQFLF